ncbi:MAG TPA: hypothetical protein PKU80_05795 [Candidatus Limiplasma sp.]|nr:hypothetical protein [Candidatus Limiplasma sp.]HRX08576.1 hypothetical protein [Candidatus Limiplasma sp.]
MLNNAGRKIVLWSQILLIVGIALSVIAGVFIIVRGATGLPYRMTVYNTTYLYGSGMLYGGRYIAAGLLTILFGSLGTWLTALLLRAFGDMADDTRAIRERLEDTSVYVKTETPAQPTAEAPQMETPEPTDG